LNFLIIITKFYRSYSTYNFIIAALYGIRVRQAAELPYRQFEIIQIHYGGYFLLHISKAVAGKNACCIVGCYVSECANKDWDN